MKTSSVSAFALAALCAASVLSSPLSAYGQQQQQTAKNTVALTNQQKFAQTNPYQNLKAAPHDLPYMPQITPPGAQFLYGMKNSSKPGRITLLLRYGTNDMPSSLIRYYADSLKQAKWKVGTVRATQLQASSQGNSCVVQCAPAASSKFRNDFQITYQLKAGAE